MFVTPPRLSQGVVMLTIPDPIALASQMLTGQFEHRDDPAAWMRSRLSEVPWSRQVEILESVRDNPETVVQSCHAAGKSFIAGRAVAWWLDTHPAGSAIAVTTAPTFPQVRAILWKEIRRAHRAGKLRGRTNQTEWWLGDELVAFGRKPADYDEEAFQGIHEEYVLVILDEAAGIPEWLWDAAGNLTTTADCRILAIGNPNVSSSEFANRCAKPSERRKVIAISAFDTPNFTGEKVPDRVSRVLVDQSWVAARTADWGTDDPRYVAKVLGQFPRDDEHGVVPYSAAEWLRQEANVAHLGPVPEQASTLGVDMGAGGDETTVWGRFGRRARKLCGFRSDDPEKTAAEIIRQIKATQAPRVNVDVIGIGWGVVGMLRHARGEADGHRAEIIGVNVGESSSDTTKFPKLRDELWWMGRELSQSKAWDLTEVDDEPLRQLTSVRWSPDPAGRVKVEPKAETKKRLGRSPDDADGLLLAFYTGGEVVAAEVPDTDRPSDPYAAERRSSVWD